MGDFTALDEVVGERKPKKIGTGIKWVGFKKEEWELLMAETKRPHLVAADIRALVMGITSGKIALVSAADAELLKATKAKAGYVALSKATPL